MKQLSAYKAKSRSIHKLVQGAGDDTIPDRSRLASCGSPVWSRQIKMWCGDGRQTMTVDF